MKDIRAIGPDLLLTDPIDNPATWIVTFTDGTEGSITVRSDMPILSQYYSAKHAAERITGDLVFSVRPMGCSAGLVTLNTPAPVSRSV